MEKACAWFNGNLTPKLSKAFATVRDKDSIRSSVNIIFEITSPPAEERTRAEAKNFALSLPVFPNAELVAKVLPCLLKNPNLDIKKMFLGKSKRSKKLEASEDRKGRSPVAGIKSKFKYKGVIL